MSEGEDEEGARREGARREEGDEDDDSDASTEHEPEGRPRKPRKLALKPSDFLPKPFTGEANQDPSAFILSFQDYTSLHQLTKDNVILNRFKLCLLGTPRAWLEQAKFKSWEECKPAFIAKYLRLYSRGVAVTEFRSATLGPDERVSDYVVRIKPIAIYLNYGDEIVRDQLLSALPTSCQEAIIMSEGETLESVIEKADKWFALKKDKTSSPAVTFPALHEDIEHVSKGIRKITLSDSSEGKYRDQSRRDYRDYRSSSRERGRGSRYDRDYDRDYSRSRDFSRNGRSYSRDRRRYYDRSQSRDRYNSQYQSSKDRRRCYFCDGDHSYLSCRELKSYMSSKGQDRPDNSQSETRNGDKNAKGNGNGNWKTKVRNYRNSKSYKGERKGKSRSNFH